MWFERSAVGGGIVNLLIASSSLLVLSSAMLCAKTKKGASLHGVLCWQAFKEVKLLLAKSSGKK
jgi:hypothetical protein